VGLKTGFVKEMGMYIKAYFNLRWHSNHDKLDRKENVNLFTESCVVRYCSVIELGDRG